MTRDFNEMTMEKANAVLSPQYSQSLAALLEASSAARHAERRAARAAARAAASVARAEERQASFAARFAARDKERERLFAARHPKRAAEREELWVTERRLLLFEEVHESKWDEAIKSEWVIVRDAALAAERHSACEVERLSDDLRRKAFHAVRESVQAAKVTARADAVAAAIKFRSDLMRELK